MTMLSSPSVFILLWNSTHSTPSPRSINDAPAFSNTTPCVRLRSRSVKMPGRGSDGLIAVGAEIEIFRHGAAGAAQEAGRGR